MMIREDDQPHRDVQHSTNSTTTTFAPTGAIGGATAAPGTQNGTGGGNDFNTILVARASRPKRRSCSAR